MGHQLRFSILQKSYRDLLHGGARVRSNPKKARPLSRKRPIHLVLKSSHARGQWSLLHPRNAKMIRTVWQRQGKRFGVRTYSFVNVGNHLHAVVRIHNPRLFQSFLRAVAGLIARQVMGAQRSTPVLGTKQKLVKFWDARPFTRLMHWGSDFDRVSHYIQRNQIQAVGFDVDVLFGDPDQMLKLAG